jgi:hypothetical protein
MGGTKKVSVSQNLYPLPLLVFLALLTPMLTSYPKASTFHPLLPSHASIVLPSSLPLPPPPHTQGLSSSMAKLHQEMLIGIHEKTCFQSLSMSTIAQSTSERSSPASESKHNHPVQTTSTTPFSFSLCIAVSHVPMQPPKFPASQTPAY